MNGSLWYSKNSYTKTVGDALIYAYFVADDSNRKHFKRTNFRLLTIKVETLS